jgi:hypothetical protein
MLSDNEIINASMMANNDWIWIVIIIVISVIALFAHFNRLHEDAKTAQVGQRWLISGKWVVCAMCVEKYLKSTVNGQEIPVKKLGNEYSHARCEDCQCTNRKN